MASNPYYVHGGTPAQGSPLSSANIRGEFDLIQAGFALLPPLVGNAGKVIRVGAGSDMLIALYNNLPTVPTFDPTAVGGILRLAADITVNAAVFASDDRIELYNTTAGNLNVFQGGGFILYLAGSNVAGNRVLATRGRATLWFASPSIAVLSGNGVS